MRIKLIFLIFFFVIYANSINANIYWLYEFYNISPNFNIFSLNDNDYQSYQGQDAANAAVYAILSGGLIGLSCYMLLIFKFVNIYY